MTRAEKQLFLSTSKPPTTPQGPRGPCALAQSKPRSGRQRAGGQQRRRAIGAGARAPALSHAQQLTGAAKPKLAELTDQVLYADIWARLELSPRDRSLVTVAAMIAINRPDQLRSHLALARTNVVTERELVEVNTHTAFYSGWPGAACATTFAKEAFEKK